MKAKKLFPHGSTRILGYLAVNTPVHPEKVKGQKLRIELFFNGDINLRPVVVSYSDHLYADSPLVGWACGCDAWTRKPEGSDTRVFCEHLQLIAQVSGLRAGGGARREAA